METLIETIEILGLTYEIRKTVKTTKAGPGDGSAPWNWGREYKSAAFHLYQGGEYLETIPWTSKKSGPVYDAVKAQLIESLESRRNLKNKIFILD